MVCLGSTDASFNLVGGFPEPTFARLGNPTKTYPVLYWQKPTICPVFIHVQKICVCCFGAILQHQLEAVEAAEENLCMAACPHTQTFPRYLQIQIVSTLWWRELLAEPSKEVGDYQTPALFEAAEKIFSVMIMFVMMSTNAGDQTTCFIWGCRARPGRRLRHWQPGQLHSVMKCELHICHIFFTFCAFLCRHIPVSWHRTGTTALPKAHPQATLQSSVDTVRATDYKIIIIIIKHSL